MTDIRKIVNSSFLDQKKWFLDSGTSECTGFGDGYADGGGYFSFINSKSHGYGGGFAIYAGGYGSFIPVGEGHRFTFSEECIDCDCNDRGKE